MKTKLLCVVFAWAGCNSPEAPKVCSIACTSDAVCPTGQTCGELGMCTDGTACPCEADAFIGCVDENSTALFCNATADGLASEACAGGCNADAGRCNTCGPNTAACSDAMTTVDHCGEDGVTITSDDCALGCVAATETAPVHCGYLKPAFLPNICDEPAAMATLDLDSIPTLDTNLDSICTGGIIDQPAPHPDVCVLRYGAVSIHGSTDTRVTGARALAIVADRGITVSSTINASAVGTTASGPGGSWTTSGMAAGLARGAGGAGFRTTGAAGGQSGAGTGGSGGAILVPDDTTGIIGGPRGGTYSTPTTGVFGGYGGGAVVLIACRGTVEVSGTIHANGGGGGGGRDVSLGTAVSVYGAGGGGAGGLVVLQGANVVLTGRLFANGGGGGAACSPSGDGCNGNPGQDGQLSTTAAAGGNTGDEFGNGNGGNGGASTSPTNGFGGSLPAGAGGGSTGYLRIYTPAGVTPTNTPVQVSPSIETSTVPTR